MPDSIDTSDGTPGTPDDAAAQAAASTGSAGAPDQVSLLTSRLNGQTAKVGSLTAERDATKTALDAALARVKALETGAVSADEAAKAQVAAAQQALEAERRERRIDSMKTRFPEAFGELGDDIAAVMDENRLTAIEARLTGGAGGSQEPPTPLRHNEPRTGTPRQAAKKETVAEIEARLLATPMPW